METVNSVEDVISNGLSFLRTTSYFFNHMFFGNSDRAVYSDLKPLDGGQSLYPMSTVFSKPKDFPLNSRIFYSPCHFSVKIKEYVC